MTEAAFFLTASSAPGTSESHLGTSVRFSLRAGECREVSASVSVRAIPKGDCFLSARVELAPAVSCRAREGGWSSARSSIPRAQATPLRSRSFAVVGASNFPWPREWANRTSARWSAAQLAQQRALPSQIPGMDMPGNY